MATMIKLRHPASGMVKSGYYGFSWTYLFFGFLVPVCRGEMIESIAHFVFNLASFWIFPLVMAFFYNKQYMMGMMEKGWQLEGTDGEIAHAKADLGVFDRTSLSPPKST